MRAPIALRGRSYAVRRSWRFSGSRRCLRATLFVGSALISLTPASGQETITYSYDALGRLVAASHSGGANNGTSSSYSYDAADNRTNVTVTGTALPPTCVGVSFAVGGASANEGSNLSFTITKSGTTSDTCNVNYATADGTAKAGTSYTAKSGLLSFAGGTASQTVAVATIDDHAVTGDLAMYLNLSSPSGSATITTAQGTGTIHNIDTSSVTIQLASGTSENLRTIANNNGYTGSSSANYTFVVGSGVIITGSAGSGVGIDTGSWPSGVTLTLTVNGTVRGGGGNGGGGGSVTTPGSAGGSGGDAIRCSAPIAITVNSGGAVQAGGGGGGGGGSGIDAMGPPFGGGGGGGGAPNGLGGGGGSSTVQSGSSGAAGTTSGGGSGGAGGGTINPAPSGGNGGSYAAGGSAGPSSYSAGGVGGAAGYSIRKNGTGCTASGAGTITGTVG